MRDSSLRRKRIAEPAPQWRVADDPGAPRRWPGGGRAPAFQVGLPAYRPSGGRLPLMSSLWTPGGEHPVGRDDDEGPIAPPADDPLAGLSPEERAQAEARAEEMAAARP